MAWKDRNIPDGASTLESMREYASRILQRLPMLASVLVGVVPCFILIQWFGVSRKLLVGFGVLAYIIGATVIKLPLYHFVVVKFLHNRLSHLGLATVQGLLSAVAELGAALVFFLFVVPKLTFTELIGFGTAAGAVEGIILPFIKPFKGTPLEEHTAVVEKRMAAKMSEEWLGVLERVLAYLPHIGARGLVYVGVVTQNVLPTLIAVATFATIDGRIYYAHLQKRAFDDPRVLGKFYLYFGAIGCLQMLCFLLFYFIR